MSHSQFKFYCISIPIIVRIGFLNLSTEHILVIVFWSTMIPPQFHFNAQDICDTWLWNEKPCKNCLKLTSGKCIFDARPSEFIVRNKWKHSIRARNRKIAAPFRNELLKSDVSTSTILTRNTQNTIGHYEYYCVHSRNKFMSGRAVLCGVFNVSKFTIANQFVSLFLWIQFTLQRNASLRTGMAFANVHTHKFMCVSCKTKNYPSPVCLNCPALATMFHIIQLQIAKWCLAMVRHQLLMRLEIVVTERWSSRQRQRRQWCTRRVSEQNQVGSFGR